MVDKKFSELTENTAPTSDDIVAVTDIGTLTSNKVTLANLGKGIQNINATAIADGSVTDIEFQYINTVSSNVQTQINGKLSNVVDDTTPSLGGDIDYSSNGVKIIGQTVGGSNGNAVYLSGSNTWTQADSSAEATCKTSLGIRISATDVLLHGVYTTTGLTAGSLYYVSETAGAITTTAPITSLSIVRPIGYALTTTELYVFPAGAYVENAWGK